MSDLRPTILLYTDGAEIDPDVIKRLPEAGYLPIKVATVDAVRLMRSPDDDDRPLGKIVKTAIIGAFKHRVLDFWDKDTSKAGPDALGFYLAKAIASAIKEKEK